LDDKADADRVVCLSAAGSDEVTESVRLLEVPVLFVAANDDFRACQLANELYGAATSAKSRKLVLLEGALHADQLLQPTAPTKPQVEDEILGEPADVADPRLATWVRRTGPMPWKSMSVVAATSSVSSLSAAFLGR
jgi:pimeloyl-ACP methyl ester carboxylesterase